MVVVEEEEEEEEEEGACCSPQPSHLSKTLPGRESVISCVVEQK